MTSLLEDDNARQRRPAGRRGAVVIALLLAVFASPAVTGPVPDPRGSPKEDAAAPQAGVPEERRISLRHLRTRERLDVIYRIGDVYQPEAMEKLNWFFRDYRCKSAARMDPALIDLLWELQAELKPGGPIRVLSAFRSEGYNASLLRAGRAVDPDSQHMTGRAVDVIFPGVPLERLREVAAARRLGGVGAYPFTGPPFVHLDTGPAREWREERPLAATVRARRKKRFVLDCSLRIADVLREIPREEALAALPDGASSEAALPEVRSPALISPAPAMRRFVSVPTPVPDPFLHSFLRKDRNPPVGNPPPSRSALLLRSALQALGMGAAQALPRQHAVENGMGPLSFGASGRPRTPDVPGF